jgi:hypothetical protein
MNKRSSQLFEQIVIALCRNETIPLHPSQDTLGMILIQEAHHIGSFAQAIVERVEAIEEAAK